MLNENYSAYNVNFNNTDNQLFKFNVHYSSLYWFGKSSTFAAKLKIYNMKTKVRLKKDVGIVLRGLRHQKSVEADVKLTQSDIANDSGLSLRYYNKLENGLAIPTIDVLLKIANIYDMTLSDLCKLIEDC